jgi:hypothetical protein
VQQQSVSVGRIVHYVLPMHFKNGGQIRAAIVVRVWSPINHPETPGMSNLTVVLDGENDKDLAGGDDASIGSVVHDPDGAPGTWHWPART